MHSLETLGAPLQSLGKLQIMGALFQTLGALLTILGEPPPPGRINTIKTLSKMIVLKSIRNGVFTYQTVGALFQTLGESPPVIMPIYQK